MCRLLGMLGGTSAPAEPWLVSTDRSLLVQANTSPEQAQHDGWGIGWYDAHRAAKFEKGVGGAFEPGERERFIAAARMAHGPVVVGHLRKASNPMHLPHERLIALENSQPFTHDGALFAHNGMIRFPKQARALLGKFEGAVRGVNDSEVLFWLFTKHVEEVGDPLAAFVRTVDDLVRAGEDHPGEAPYTGLNVVYARGPNELWGFCHWRGEHGTRFLDPTRPYYEMTYLADAKLAIIGSEPFDSTRSDWRSIENGTFVCAQASHGLVAVRTGRIPLDATAAVPSPSAT